MRRLADRRVTKEADKISLQQLPNPTQYRAWIMATRQKVVAASGKGEATHKWLLEIDSPETKFEDLEKSGRKFESLDINESEKYIFGKLLLSSLPKKNTTMIMGSGISET